jgi:acyl carrier protein
LETEFEIENPDLDENLADEYEFDSIDAIDLLVAIEKFLKTELTVEEKKAAIDIKNVRQLFDYVEKIASSRKS